MSLSRGRTGQTARHYTVILTALSRRPALRWNAQPALGLSTMRYLPPASELPSDRTSCKLLHPGVSARSVLIQRGSAQGGHGSFSSTSGDTLDQVPQCEIIIQCLWTSCTLITRASRSQGKEIHEKKPAHIWTFSKLPRPPLFSLTLFKPKTNC